MICDDLIENVKFDRNIRSNWPGVAFLHIVSVDSCVTFTGTSNKKNGVKDVHCSNTTTESSILIIIKK